MKDTHTLRLMRWNVGDFLFFTLGLQFLTIASIMLDLPVVRQVIGFLYLSMVPGAVILRALKLEWKTVIEEISLSIGLSISLLMLLGLLINETAPLAGIMHPLSIFPLMFSLTTTVSMICIYIYLTEKGLAKPEDSTEQEDSTALREKRTWWPTVVILLALPFLSIFGSLLARSFSTNVVLLLLILGISSIYLLPATSKKILPERLYPLAIGAITIALLLQTTMVSQYITGWDLHKEYYSFQLTRNNFSWNPVSPLGGWKSMTTQSYNTMLSVTILPTFYSIVLGLNDELLFKIAYPILFSVVPLVLFEVYRKRFGKQRAILSIFFFISFQTFFTEMAYIARQMIAEVFFALLLLLWIRGDQNSHTFQDKKKVFLLVIFSFGLVVSHYAMTYFYIFFVFIIWLFTRIKKNTKSTVGTTYLLLIATLAFSWYVYTFTSAPFLFLVKNVQRMASNFFQFFNFSILDPKILKALGLGAHISDVHDIGRLIFYAVEFFIFLGFIKCMLHRKKLKFDPFYFWALFASMGLLFLSVIVPYFATSLNMTRIFHITLFFLAPAFVIGVETFLNFMFETRRHRRDLILVSLVIVIFFLFQSGFIFAITDDFPTSPSLTIEKAMIVRYVGTLGLYDSFTFGEEVLGARWISVNIEKQSKVYCDVISGMQVLKSYGMLEDDQIYFLSSNTEIIGNENAYVYLRHLNTVHGIMEDDLEWGLPQNSRILSMKNRIYANGGSEIYVTLNASGT